VAGRQPTVEIDESLIEAARAVARRTGVSEGGIYERALREVLSRDFGDLMNESANHQAAPAAKRAARVVPGSGTTAKDPGWPRMCHESAMAVAGRLRSGTTNYVFMGVGGTPLLTCAFPRGRVNSAA
jgi:hypothetical protein